MSAMSSGFGHIRESVAKLCGTVRTGVLTQNSARVRSLVHIRSRDEKMVPERHGTNTSRQLRKPWKLVKTHQLADMQASLIDRRVCALDGQVGLAE